MMIEIAKTGIICVTVVICLWIIITDGGKNR